MGDMTTTNLVRMVSRNLGFDTVPTAGTDDATDIEQWLNWAQKLIVKKHHYKCMERTDSSLILIDGQLRYELPPQIQHIKSARLIDDTCYVLSDCESGWADAGAQLTTTHDGTFRREGRYSTKIVSTADPTGQISYSSDRSSALDLSGITAGALGFWIYTTTALTAGQVQIVLTEDSAGAETTQYITCNVPAVSAYKWSYCKITTDSSGDALDFSSSGTLIDAFLSVGVKFAANVAATIYIDGINLYKASFGGMNWPLRVMHSTDLDERVPNPQYVAENRPMFLVQSGDAETEIKTLETFPVPDDSYPLWIRYYKWPNPLDYTNNASAKSELENLDMALVFCATWIGLASQKKWDSAGKYQSLFYRELSDSEHDDDYSDGWEPQAMGFSAFGDSYSDMELPSATQGDERGGTSGFFYLY